MKLSDALEIKARTKRKFLLTDPIRFTDEFEEADRIIIEAGKRLQRNRGDFFQPSSDLLPGETPE